MKKRLCAYLFCLTLFMISCSYSGADRGAAKAPAVSTQKEAEPPIIINADDILDTNSGSTESPVPSPIAETKEYIDLSNHFQGINGCAVFFDTKNREYSIYNSELSDKRSSPCSTFKIISTLIGLETGVTESAESKLAWSGTSFPFDEWNQDLTLKQAFKLSCVWYFKEVLNQAGAKRVKDILTEISYGNCDIDRWEGDGANGDYSELNGFWLESSLSISPLEQVDALRRIFEGNVSVNEDYLAILKDIMKIEAADDFENVYGKTGTGYIDGLCVDAWFVGFFEKADNTYYFALILDAPDNSNVSGNKAKEIALNIIKNRY